MKQLKRIGKWVLGILLVLVVLLVGSMAVDALLGSGRVDTLTNTEIETPDGRTVRAYVTRPGSPTPAPAVIMIHEFWGLRQDIIGKADALAKEGYVVIAPDTYRGRSTGWLPRAILLALRTSQEQVNADLDAVFAWAADDPDVLADQIAVMGFCYGGGKSLRYSLHNDQVAATGVFYGDPITEPAQLAALPGPLLGIFGREDQSIPVSEVMAFRDALEHAGVPHQVTVYDGVGHAFVTDVEAIRAGGAPGEAWAEFVAFLDERLAAPGR